MTLEQTVSFSEKEDAEMVKEWLRQNGLSARLTTQTELHESEGYSGTIADFEKLLDAHKDILDSDDKELISVYKISELLIRGRKETIQKFYDEHTEGDVLHLEDLAGMFNPEKYGLGDEADDEESDESSPDRLSEQDANDYIMPVINNTALLTTLVDENLLIINDEDDSVTFAAKKPIDEIRIHLDRCELPDFDIREYFNNNISTHAWVADSDTYTLTLSVETVINITFTAFSHFFEENEILVEDEDDFLAEMRAKLFLVSVIVDRIRNGCTSVEELHDFLLHPTEEIGISYKISEEYLRGVLSDLKNAHIISTKNGRLKVLSSAKI